MGGEQRVAARPGTSPAAAASGAAPGSARRAASAPTSARTTATDRAVRRTVTAPPAGRVLLGRPPAPSGSLARDAVGESGEMDTHGRPARRRARGGARSGRGGVAWRARLRELTVEEKTGPGDLVSEADREAEAAAREVLARRRPADAVVGEEAAATGGTSGVAWHVDPVDGTTNYLYGRDDWCVSVAAWRDGAGARRRRAGAGAGPRDDRDGRGRRVVRRRAAAGAPSAVAGARGRRARARTRRAAGARRRSWCGTLVPRVRDVRRGGSAAIALANVARGCADAVWSPGLQTVGPGGRRPARHRGGRRRGRPRRAGGGHAGVGRGAGGRRRRGRGAAPAAARTPSPEPPALHRAGRRRDARGP